MLQLSLNLRHRCCGIAAATAIARLPSGSSSSHQRQHPTNSRRREGVPSLQYTKDTRPTMAALHNVRGAVAPAPLNREAGRSSSSGIGGDSTEKPMRVLNTAVLVDGSEPMTMEGVRAAVPVASCVGNLCLCRIFTHRESDSCVGALYRKWWDAVTVGDGGSHLEQEHADGSKEGERGSSSTRSPAALLIEEAGLPVLHHEVDYEFFAVDGFVPVHMQMSADAHHLASNKSRNLLDCVCLVVLPAHAEAYRVVAEQLARDCGVTAVVCDTTGVRFLIPPHDLASSSE